jgi:hypothetical protein
MEQYMNFPGCTNGGGQFINNTMVNQGHVPVSTLNYCVTSSSERKCQLCDQMTHYVHDSGSGLKKSKFDASISSSPMLDNPNRVEALILKLSSNSTNMSEKLEKRISELETNFEERVSEKLSEKISNMIDNKMKVKISEVKTEVKQELDGMKSKIESIDKQVVDNYRNSTDKVRNIFIIKNLEYNEREKNEPDLTKNKVQGLLRDGLGLANVQIKNASRKESRGKYPDVVVVETDTFDERKEIMKNKAKLKSSRQYDRVYIENDMPTETRNFQNAVRTVLKELGREKNYTFAESRLIPKHM